MSFVISISIHIDITSRPLGGIVSNISQKKAQSILIQGVSIFVGTTGRKKKIFFRFIFLQKKRKKILEWQTHKQKKDCGLTVNIILTMIVVSMSTTTAILSTILIYVMTHSSLQDTERKVLDRSLSILTVRFVNHTITGCS